MESKSKDQIVELTLPNKYHRLLKKYPHLKPSIQVRLIKKTNRKGKTQIFCTSLIDQETYSRNSLINLYKQRWGIEEAYKLIKCRLEVADFSGLTRWAIEQDFFAKTFMISLMNIICHEIKVQKPKKNTGNKNETKRIPIINRTYALAHLKPILRNLSFSLNELDRWIINFKDRISKHIEYSRRNQANIRKSKPLIKYAMAYKSV